MDQPGKVVNRARGQLNRESEMDMRDTDSIEGYWYKYFDSLEAGYSFLLTNPCM